MEPEEKEILHRVLKLSEQNNRMLRAMRRSALIGRFMHLLYWVIIIGISVISYYYIQPYLGTITSALDTIGELKDIRY